jgi:hypothetical protein
MFEFWLIRAGVPCAFLWAAGYFAHRRRPESSDIWLPWILRLPFGNPRSDGSLNTIGLLTQIFGYLLVITSGLLASKIIGSEIAVKLILGGVTLLGMGLFLVLWRDHVSH